MADIQTISGRTGAVDLKAFQTDPKGTLGYLRHPYQKAVLAFQYIGGVWALQRDIITYANHGNGEAATETGYDGTQGDGDTSFLKAGFPSSISYFTVTGIALKPSSLVTAPAIVSGTGTTDLVVARTGTSRNDCQGISGELLKAALEGAYVEFFEQGRKCFALIGLADQLPQGLGLASLNDVTNGLCGKCNMEKTRRPLIIPGSNGNNDSYNWRVTFARKQAVAADPSFAAPDVNAVAALMLTLMLEGYFSDSSGAPLISEGDVYEADIAASVACGS